MYSPDVSIIRAPESQGHVFLSEPFNVSIVACPGIYRPQIEASGKLAAKHVQQLEQKLDLVLKVEACFGHDSVVLGPMGCGGMLSMFASLAHAGHLPKGCAVRCSLAQPPGRGGAGVCKGLTEGHMGAAAGGGSMSQHRQSGHGEEPISVRQVKLPVLYRGFVSRCSASCR